MSESSALALIDKAGTISTKEASSDIKSSLLFTARWESLLMSAPIALSSLGACYVASSSEIARTIKLTIPKDSKLTTPSLPANLVECGNLGTNAFIEAEAAMGSIHMNSKMVDMKVADIINALGDPTMAKRNLPSHLNNLMGAAQECLQRALDMDKKFDEWLEFICDLRVACVEQSSTTEDELRTGKINQLSEKTRLDYQTMAVASAENATKRLEQELTVASEAFKKASDEYPTGWDIVGQQIVSGLADTFNTAVNAAIPVLMQHLSPFKNFTAAAGAVGDFIDDIQDDETPQSQRPPTNGATSTRPSGPAPTASNQIPVPHITDPAYSQINTYMLYLNILNDLLSSGKDKGVNWDKARGSEKTDPKTTAKFLVSMFSDAKQSFAGLATKAQASTDYRDVIETALEVATAVEKEVNKGTSASYELPKGGSALVNLWQQKFRDAYLKAYGLYSTAKALPGNPPNGFPLIQSTPLESSTDPKSDQAQAILESAKNRLNTTQEAYRTTQDNFLASAEMLTTQKVRLGEIQSKITDLQMMTMDLENVKMVLQDCIALVVSIKNDVANLVRFFNAISIVIDSIVRRRVKDWADTISSSVSSDGSTEIAKIGDYTLADGQREIIYRGAVLIRSYFSLYADIASMWMKLSVDSIQPGIAFVEELSIYRGQDETQEKARKLQAWSKKASAQVEREAKEYYDKMMNGMDQRIQSMQRITKQLPASEVVLDAITTGINKAKRDANRVVALRSEIAVTDGF